MAKHIPQWCKTILDVVIDLPSEVADGDAGFHWRTDARGEPAGEQEGRERRDEHRGRKPQVHVALQCRKQRGGARDDNPALLDTSRSIGGVDVWQCHVADDERRGVGRGGIAGQSQTDAELGVTREALHER